MDALERPVQLGVVDLGRDGLHQGFVDEQAHVGGQALAPAGLGLRGDGEQELLLRARQRDVEQAAVLLLALLVFVELEAELGRERKTRPRAAVRLPFGGVDVVEHDTLELQALGRVRRHERDGGAGVGLLVEPQGEVVAVHLVPGAAQALEREGGVLADAHVGVAHEGVEALERQLLLVAVEGLAQQARLLRDLLHERPERVAVDEATEGIDEFGGAAEPVGVVDRVVVALERLRVLQQVAPRGHAAALDEAKVLNVVELRHREPDRGREHELHGVRLDGLPIRAQAGDEAERGAQALDERLLEDVDAALEAVRHAEQFEALDEAGGLRVVAVDDPDLVGVDALGDPGAQLARGVVGLREFGGVVEHAGQGPVRVLRLVLDDAGVGAEEFLEERGGTRGPVGFAAAVCLAFGRAVQWAFQRAVRRAFAKTSPSLRTTPAGSFGGSRIETRPPRVTLDQYLIQRLVLYFREPRLVEIK